MFSAIQWQNQSIWLKGYDARIILLLAWLLIAVCSKSNVLSLDLTKTKNEDKEYFSNKHVIFCLKREFVAPHPNGSLEFISFAFPNSKRNFFVFLTSLDKYKAHLAKTTADMSIDDVPNQVKWTIMADKGNVGIERVHWSIIPKRSQLIENQLRRKKLKTEEYLLQEWLLRIF